MVIVRLDLVLFAARIKRRYAKLTVIVMGFVTLLMIVRMIRIMTMMTMVFVRKKTTVLMNPMKIKKILIMMGRGTHAILLNVAMVLSKMVRNVTMDRTMVMVALAQHPVSLLPVEMALFKLVKNATTETM